MKITPFPYLGDKQLDLKQNGDGVDIVEVDGDGATINILFQVKNGGGHAEVGAHALENLTGWETVENPDTHLQTVLVH